LKNDTNIVDVSTENIDYINIMKTKSTLLAVASISALLTGCVYDDGSGYYNNYQTSPGVYPQVQPQQYQYNQPRVYRTTTTVITTRRNSQGSHCNHSQNNGYYNQNNGYNNGYNGQNNGYNGQNNGFFGALFGQNNGYNGQNNGYNSGNNGYNTYQGQYQGSGKAGSYSNNSGLGGYNNGYRPY